MELNRPPQPTDPNFPQWLFTFWNNTAGSTYTPTLTGVANATGLGALVCQYIRVKKSVTVSGKLTCTLTSASVPTQIGISLPFSSNFTTEESVAGTCYESSASAVYGGVIKGDTTNKTALLSLTTTSSGATSFFFQFTYRIV